MLSKNEMNNLFVETAPPLLAFLEKEKGKIENEVKRLQKKVQRTREELPADLAEEFINPPEFAASESPDWVTEGEDEEEETA